MVSPPAGTVVRGMTTWEYHKDIVWVALSDHTIRTLNLTTGKMTLFAGAPGVAGSADGDRQVATFNSPGHIVAHPTRPWLLLTESNSGIRLIQTENDVVRTLPVSAREGGLELLGITVDPAENVYVGSNTSHFVSVEKFMTPWTSTPFVNLASKRILGIPDIPGYTNGAGRQVLMNSPWAIQWAHNQLWWTEQGNSVVRKYDPSLDMTSLVMGSAGDAWELDSSDPLSCQLASPQGLAWGPGPTLYIADSLNHVVRQINSSGVASRFIGHFGVPGSSDGNLSTANVNAPSNLLVTRDGSTLLFVDAGGAIRQVALPHVNLESTILVANVTAETVATLLGVGPTGFLADGAVPNNQAVLDAPVGLATHPLTGDLYVSLPASHIILRVTNTTTYVELGVPGVSSQEMYTVPSPTGDDGPAEGARLNRPTALIFMPGTALLIFSEVYPRCRVRSYNSTSRVITTVAGTAICGFWTGQGSAPASANIGEVVDMVLHPATGELYMVDRLQMSILRLSPDFASFQVVAGLADTYAPLGDGLGPVRQRLFNYPQGLAFHPLPPYHLFIGDTLNGKVKRLNMDSGLVELVAGVGTGCIPSTDPTPPLSTCLSGPRSLWVDPSGSTLYIADGTILRTLPLAANGSATNGALSAFAGSIDAGGGDSMGIVSASTAHFRQLTKLLPSSPGHLLASDMIDRRIRLFAVPVVQAPPPPPPSALSANSSSKVRTGAIVGGVVGGVGGALLLILLVLLFVRSRRGQDMRAKGKGSDPMVHIEMDHPSLGTESVTIDAYPEKSMLHTAKMADAHAKAVSMERPASDNLTSSIATMISEMRGSGGSSLKASIPYVAPDSGGGSKGSTQVVACMAEAGAVPVTSAPSSAVSASHGKVLVMGSLHWTRGQLLGEGAYGQVYAGLNLATGQHMAVKEVKMEHDRDHARELHGELSLYSQLFHEHVVGFLGSHLDLETGSLHIFMEYVGGGSMANMLHKFGAFSEGMARKYTRQILLGLAYLHSKRIIHRDLKGANLLVTLDGVVKLADFGASRSMGANVGTHSTGMQSLKGSVFWISPEMVKGTGYGRRTDIWSLGCTVIEMLTGQHPWPNLSGEQNAWTVMFQVANTKTGPPRPEGISAEAQDFLNRCLCFDAKDRATTEELLLHPFVTSQDE